MSEVEERSVLGAAYLSQGASEEEPVFKVCAIAGAVFFGVALVLLWCELHFTYGIF